MSLNDDLRTADEALRAADFRHAAHHLAGAVGAAPQATEVLALLERFATALGDAALEQVPEEDGIFHGSAALRSWLLQRAGHLTDASRLLLRAQGTATTTDYSTWLEAWFGQSGALTTIDPDVIAADAYNTLNAVSDPSKKRQLVGAMEQLLLVHPDCDLLFFTVCIQLRKLGDRQRALALAKERVATRPSYHAHVALAGALKAVGDDEAAIEAQRGALQYKPDDVPIRLDIGDTLLDLRRLPEALVAYDEALRIDPANSWARAGALYLRARLARDSEARRELLTLAASEGRSGRASYLAVKLAPFEAGLPPRHESCLNLAADSLRTGDEIVEMAISGFEAPSALKAMRDALGEVRVGVGEIPTPDPRLPRTGVPFVLWTFRPNGLLARLKGTLTVEGRPALSPPDGDVADLVAKMASAPFSRNGWWLESERLALTLGGRARSGALACMVHWPQDPGSGEQLWNWAFRVQVACALILGHTKADTPNDLQTHPLVSVLNGPVDWVSTAALFALCEWAQHRPTVDAEVQALLLHAALETPLSPVAFMCLIEPALQLCRYWHLPDDVQGRLDARRKELEID
jgi:tetratricopeptide (TPR) repeat protein